MFNIIGSLLQEILDDGGLSGFAEVFFVMHCFLVALCFERQYLTCVLTSYKLSDPLVQIPWVVLDRGQSGTVEVSFLTQRPESFASGQKEFSC